MGRCCYSFRYFFWNAIFSAFWGLYGYVISLLFFPPVFVMNCLLMEPMVSQVIGVALNIDEWPGWMSFLGVAIVIVSINLMYFGEVKRTDAKVDEEQNGTEI